MTRYRARPREVEAVQWQVPVTGYIVLFGTALVVDPSDWIVTDATGHRIVKAADFAEQFEEIDDE